MTDDERIDRLLRETLAADAPGLSTGFDAELARRLRSRRLGRMGRLLVVAYALAALAASVWVMRSASLDWTYVTVAVAPVLVLGVVYQRRLARAP